MQNIKAVDYPRNVRGLRLPFFPFSSRATVPYRANKLQTQLPFTSSAKYRLPNEKTYNPLRKPFPHKTPRETASHATQYYTAAIQNATFKANHIHRSVKCFSHSQILPLPHFYIPQNVNPHNKLLR